MVKKLKKLVLGILIILVVFSLILISLPLPQGITEILLTARLNNFLPGCRVELDKSKFYFFRGIMAESIRFIKDGQVISTCEKLKLEYEITLVLTGRGKLKLTSGALNVKKFPAESEFLNFLSNIIGPSFEDELIFNSFLLESDINKNKLIMHSFKATGKDLKIVAAGEIEKGRGVDFTVDIFLSKRITETMPEGTKKFLFEPQKDGFSKIRFEIYGLPKEPSFKIKTQFLELNVG